MSSSKAQLDKNKKKDDNYIFIFTERRMKISCNQST